MARAQIEFFATRDDLAEVLTDVEARRQLAWVRAGLFDEPPSSAFDSLLSIPDLDIAPGGSAPACPAFLAAAPPFTPVARPVAQRRGGTKHAIDQLGNPGTILLRPGGQFRSSAMIAGSLGTTSTDPASVELYELFLGVLRSHFSTIKSYRVGREAARLLDAGWRLTANVGSPAIYDLTRG